MPGQRVAVIVGVPVMLLMQRSYGEMLDWFIPSIHLKAVFLFAGFFVVPYVYVRGVGMLIAVIAQLVINARK